MENIAQAIEQMDIEDLIPYARNSRTHSDEQVSQIASSIKEFGFTNPILIDQDGGIIAGHGRVLAARKLGLSQVPAILVDYMTEAQKRAYVIADNKLALNAGWDDELLSLELGDLKEAGFDLSLTGFNPDELAELMLTPEVIEGLTDENQVPEVPVNPVTVQGDVWILGGHRLMCGDSTSIDAIEKLMNGKKADLVFTDPPYGMKKENDGVLNDNLNFSDLLEFNRQWIPLSFAFLKENGSWYCWGIDEPLMDIYSEILKPMIKSSMATFRNLITWDKGSGQGQNSELTRSYATADEKCLFVMCGVQGFNNNSDNYFDGFDSIREYLVEEKETLGWNVSKVIEITGKSSASHYFTTSQWAFPIKEHYEAMQSAADGDGFLREYDEIKREYDEIKREYDEIKREYYSTRAYFNNTHDNFNNVWHFDRHIKDGSEGGHATPKPIPLCERAILSSSQKDEIVLDFFGGSGSTMIACEIQGRKARLIELDPKYCDVIVTRWEEFTGKKATLESTSETFKELKSKRLPAEAK